MQGDLVLIGGSEDKVEDKTVLRHFVTLTNREQPRIVVLTAASGQPGRMWAMYDEAFADLGVGRRETIPLASRETANEPAIAASIYDADGIFMTGGDQQRLMSIIGGTAVADAMHRAFRERGVCVAGTSAGASAMSEHMLAEGATGGHVTRHGVSLGVGLGFVQRAVIDQHFSERQRLSRLLSVVGQNPHLLGIGIDENTALVIRPRHGFEVIGEGAVTFIDGRRIETGVDDAERRHSELLTLVNVALHVLPSGVRCVDDRTGGERPVPPALRDIVGILSGEC